MLCLSLVRNFLSLLIVGSILFVSSSLLAANPSSKPTQLTPLWREDVLTLEMVQTSKVAVQTELDAIPADSKKDGVDGHKKTSLKKELELIGELEGILGRVWQLTQVDKSRKKRESTILKELKKEKSRPKFQPPKSPNLDEFEI